MTSDGDSAAPVFEAELSSGRRLLTRRGAALLALAAGWFLWRLFGSLAQPEVSPLATVGNLLAALATAVLLAVHLRALIHPAPRDVLRIDAAGLHLPGQDAPLAWADIRAVQVNRSGEHLLRSKVLCHGGASYSLPFARLTPAEATRALAVLRHHLPDTAATQA